MAKSKARKMREKRIKEGRLDPVLMRGTHAGLYERKTKTKQEKWVHDLQKHKKNLRDYEHEDFFIVTRNLSFII